uniref:Ubiquitous surface protein A2 n=1 Tax=Moraxella catarrhalis TaxID=480 RepID=M4QTE8_MORCA|nr:ubiquitous surface protein A2 precursor [Moraxella catarrhalis]
MKTMKLLPLKIAVTSAMIIGLGVASTANAQDKNDITLEKVLKSIEKINQDELKEDINEYASALDQYLVLSQYGNLLITNELNKNVEKNSNSIANLEDGVGYLAENQNTLIEQNETINQELEGITHELESFIAYAHAQDQKNLVNEFEIEKNKDAIAKNNDSIEDLYDFGHEVAESIGKIHAHNEAQNETLKELITNSVKNTDNITKNKADIKELENNVGKDLLDLSGRLIAQKEDIDNNINHIYELAQQQDQHSSDIKTLQKNVEEGLLELSGHLIDQKSDIAQNQTDIQDLATYNELQDQYAQKQTEAIDALNKASSENTQNIAKNSNRIKALESNVEEGLLELSGHLIDQKADLTKDIKTLESNVEEGLLDLSGRLLDQKADIAQNQANIQDLAAYNELQDQYAQKQTEAIDALNKASSENTQNIEDLAAYNELQDAYAKQQTEAIDALNKASSENTQNIAKNQADIANNINNIYELAQQQDQHSSDIKTLAKVSAANTDRIAKNKADADASFETLTKNQNTLIEKDKEHDKLITANKTAIDANKASADTKFAATADAITKNGNAITKNAKSITDLGTKVDGFDGRVTALDTKVNAFDGRITALDSKVENGMAAQAALSGLFQPYSVGKFNATAALGGYGSKSAVAIGAGYRVNPNLAFKAGAAINTSGNKKGSYNIGVNYEF